MKIKIRINGKAATIEFDEAQLRSLLFGRAADLAATDDDLDKRIRFQNVPDLPEMPEGQNGGKISQKTVFRWAQHGIGGVKLKYEQAGGAKVTTRRWIREFFERLGTNTPNDQRTPSEARRAHVEAEKRLAAAGLL